MSTNHIYVEKKNEIATIYFNNPQKRNAFTFQMWETMASFLEELEKDSAIKVLILRGVDETAFAAGADINEFMALRTTSQGVFNYNETAHRAVRKLNKFKKPTIAMIQGPCIGGGSEIALSCDIRFTDNTGRFGIPPAKLGIVYGLSGTKKLVDLVGPSNAKYLLYSGKTLHAEQALRMGLVNEIYSSETIVEETYKYAETLCRNSQFSIRNMKYIFGEISRGVLEDTEETIRLQQVSFNGEDHEEGVNAFLEKRKPSFKYS